MAEAVSAAFARGGGEVVVLDEKGGRTGFREAFACDGCGRIFRVPEPALFSFNSPLGACGACQGFGRVPGLDFNRVVPDASRSIEEGAIAPFTTAMGRRLQRDLVRSCRARKVSIRKPFGELTSAPALLGLRGGRGRLVRGAEASLNGSRGAATRCRRRVLIARYRRFDPCPGLQRRTPVFRRAQREAGRASTSPSSVVSASRSYCNGAKHWNSSPRSGKPGDRVLDLLRARLATVEEVGLGYMPLDRPMRTLSGGGGPAHPARYRPRWQPDRHSVHPGRSLSVGLHARDVARLLGVLETIRAQGNTVVVGEHAPEIIAAAHHIIDLGPAAGHAGGEVVVEGTLAAVRSDARSATGRALRGECALQREGVRKSTGAIRVRGARENNLTGLDVEFPLGNLTVVTGVSGAGKSSLVRSVLVGHLRGDPDRGVCDAVEGAKLVSEVVVVTQSPASRTPRSNPATVSKAFEGIRRRFAATREAKAADLAPGDFSFNVPGGRCEACEGAGEVVIDMQFLDDVRVPCDDCGGRRYRREILGIHWQGQSIADVLDLTLVEALELFAREKRIVARLEPFVRVGLGYLALGQPLSTLSGWRKPARAAGARPGGEQAGCSLRHG